MQMWNDGELLLVLCVIVLSVENNFERPQLIIVLMKQMWKTAYQRDTVNKATAETHLQVWRCLLFSVQFAFDSGGAGSLFAVIKLWDIHLHFSVLSGGLLPTLVLMN